jgi:hypothetical protein
LPAWQNDRTAEFIAIDIDFGRELELLEQNERLRPAAGPGCTLEAVIHASL